MMRVLVVMLAAVAALAQGGRTVWDGVFTADQAGRGKEVYGKQCSSCHGPDLTGGESAPPLAGPEFLSNWTGQSVGNLFDRTRQSMPANDPGKLTRAQAADVISYLLQANGFPAGKAEMDTQSEALKQIQITQKK